MKVVINNCFGGFSISRECAELMEKLGCPQAKEELEDWRKRLGWFNHKKMTGEYPEDMPQSNYGIMDIEIKYDSEPKFYWYGYSNSGNGYSRDSKYLIEAVEKLGAKANGGCAELKVVEIPDGVEYTISEYDGNEHIAESHRTWS